MRYAYRFLLYLTASAVIVYSLYISRVPVLAKSYPQNFLPLAGPMIVAPIQNQADPKWSMVTLGPTGPTMGMKGCLVTALSSGLANAALTIDPGQLAKRLSPIGGFTSDGSLQLAKLDQAVPGVFFKDRVYTTLTTDQANVVKMNVDVAVENIRHYVDMGMLVAVNVDAVGGDGISDHWVLVVDSDFTIVDPGYGERVPFSKRYKTPETGIYGYIIYVISPIGFPDATGLPRVGQAKYKLSYALHNGVSNQYVREAYDVL
jgi:hypothetical protein